MARAGAQELRKFADNTEFRAKWVEVKDVAKAKAMARIRDLTGEALPDNAMLDIQARAPPAVPCAWQLLRA